MKLWIKLVIGGIGALGAMVCAVVWLGWSLSAKIDGARLERVEASPQYENGTFVNVERQAPSDLTLAYVKDQLFGSEQRVPPGEVPVIAIDTEALKVRPPKGLRATWLGHASVLIELDEYRILIDPMLSDRASPFQALGPQRTHPSPLALEEFMGIDAVVISHNHYDHLDEATIRHLAVQGTKFFIPLGVGAHLEGWDISASQIFELDWWEEVKLGPLTFTSTPNRHYSSRGLFDYNKTLWSSWAIVGPEHRVFYSGDTGYSKLFKSIGQRLGPFDLTVIKIGSYGPAQSWLDVHMLPEDAVRIHKELGGMVMLPVHWMTFNLALHTWNEPIIRASKEAGRQQIEMLTPRIGEIVSVGTPFENTPWWEDVK